MAALGCILLLVFPMIGAVLGVWLGGPDGMAIGAAAGFLIALAACAVPGIALRKARRR